MLRWTEGAREKGCDYHKKATFNLLVATGQVDVFVMPKIRKARPIAITLNVTTRTAGKKTLKGSVAVPDEIETLQVRLTPKLAILGFGPNQAAALVVLPVAVKAASPPAKPP